MLTQEQIYKLKRGDEIIIHGTFDTAFDDGDISVDSYWTVNGKRKDQSFMVHSSCVSLPSEHGTSVPTPKYDPCRLLRKGDRVQVKKRNGRCNGKAGEYLREAFCEVAEDEVPNERVRVFHNSSEYRLDPAYLELVTPVEELEPYTVDECGFAPTLYVRKNGKVCMTIPYKEGSSLYQTREEALAAAETLRDRLNAEHRNEQQK